MTQSSNTHVCYLFKDVQAFKTFFLSFFLSWWICGGLKWASFQAGKRREDDSSQIVWLWDKLHPIWLKEQWLLSHGALGEGEGPKEEEERRSRSASWVWGQRRDSSSHCSKCQRFSSKTFQEGSRECRCVRCTSFRILHLRRSELQFTPSSGGGVLPWHR